MDTVFFALSKGLGAFLKVETWLLALAGLTFWASMSARIKVARYGSAVLALAILGLGLFPLGDVLMRPLEAEYPAGAAPAEVDGIVLLGGGEDVAASLYSGQPQLGEGGDRYLAALALARANPDARLLFAGGSGRLRDITGNEVSEAAVAERIFQAQGIAPRRLLLEGQSRNTNENARLSYALAEPKKDETWVLITSAFHMPRALGSFSEAGWPALIPFPVDFRSRDWSDGLGWNFQRNLEMTNIALREWVGRLVYSVTGR